MLQQILRDMYVDPEILAELPEEQKEMLFYKLRQEQIRRYNEREKENLKKNNHRRVNNNGKSGSLELLVCCTEKKVRILEDGDGKPWTWVFGERREEVTVEEKWKRLAEKRADAAIKAVIQEEEEQIIKRRSWIKDGDTLYSNGRRSPENGTRTELLCLKQKANRKSPSASPSLSPNLTPVLKRPTKPIPKKSPVTSASSSPVLARKENNMRKATSNVKGDRAITPPSPGSRRATEQHHVIVKQSLNRAKELLEKPEVTSKAALPQQNQTVMDKLRRGEVRRVLGSQRQKVSAAEETISSQTNSDNEKEDLTNKENETTEPLYESFDPLPKENDEAVSNEEWNRQLRSFKEADERRSIRARRASKEFRRQSMLASDPEKLRAKLSNMQTKISTRPRVPPKPSTLRRKHPAARPGKSSKPKNHQEVKEWFEETQYNVFITRDVAPTWFHGIIARPQAESILKDKTKGDFLIRVSDKIWGFALSYKDDDKIKHFLIDASEPQCYHFFGNDQIRHGSLDELVEYHKEESISYNGEKLSHPVGQVDSNNSDYYNLKVDDSDTRL